MSVNSAAVCWLYFDVQYFKIFVGCYIGLLGMWMKPVGQGRNFHPCWPWTSSSNGSSPFLHSTLVIMVFFFGFLWTRHIFACISVDQKLQSLFTKVQHSCSMYTHAFILSCYYCCRVKCTSSIHLDSSSCCKNRC